MRLWSCCTFSKHVGACDAGLALWLTMCFHGWPWLLCHTTATDNFNRPTGTWPRSVFLFWLTPPFCPPLYSSHHSSLSCFVRSQEVGQHPRGRGPQGNYPQLLHSPRVCTQPLLRIWICVCGRLPVDSSSRLCRFQQHVRPLLFHSNFFRKHFHQAVRHVAAHSASAWQNPSSRTLLSVSDSFLA